ncbi:MAG: hypothetical protein KA419_18790 [Acidobacteria bacterium]|nr:hypothetical protein [Acidobacteriota bacterium]
MKYRVCIDDHHYTLVLEDIFPDPAHEIPVEVGYHRYKAKMIAWDADKGIRSILLDGVPYDIEFFRNEQGAVEAVKIDNETYAINEVRAGKLQAARPVKEPVKEGVVKAFMPGLITRAPKKPGDRVKEGETVLYLEAMKMENAIKAPRDGELKRIAQESSTVLTGDILFVVE